MVVRIRAAEFPPNQAWAAGGKFELYFTAAGNLELWDTQSDRLLWQSATSNAAKLVMHEDGNLAIYSKDDRPLWTSNTGGNPGAVLAIQDDGNVVIYSGDTPIWDTKTNEP